MFACMVAGNVGLLGTAARSRLEGLNRASASDVLSNVAGVLHQHGKAQTQTSQLLQMLAAEGATPGATESLNSALATVISEIEQSVEPTIKAGHADTQQAIDASINALESTTGTAVEFKQAADNADNEWFTCVRNEQAQLVAVEEADSAMQSSRTTETEACQLQEDRKAFSWQSDEFPSQFDCDNAEASACSTELSNFETQVNDLVASLKETLAQSESDYAEAKAGCDTAKEDLVAKQSAHDTALTAWNEKKVECLSLHETRTVSMCNFGSELQRKCADVTAYHDLLAQVDAVNGGVYSRPDRVAEWTTVHMTKCMLGLVQEGADLDASAIEQCEISADYDNDVGTLLRRDSEFAELTTADQFTCQETTITFSGQTWQVPTGDDAASSDYVVLDYSADVNLAEDPVFSECSEDTAGPGKP